MLLVKLTVLNFLRQSICSLRQLVGEIEPGRENEAKLLNYSS